MLFRSANALKREISQSGSLPVPLHIRDAPTGLMKDLGYGKDYKYDHDYEGGFSGQTGLPDELRDRVFYQPADVGFEREIKKRMDWWERKRAEVRGASDEQSK